MIIFRYCFFLILLLILNGVDATATESDLAALKEELSTLEKRVSEYVETGVELTERETFVGQILDLRDRIEALTGSVDSENSVSVSGDAARVYTLVRVDGHQYPGEDFTFNENSLTFTARRESNTSSELFTAPLKQSASIGFEQFPDTIELGKEFTIVASMVFQQDVGSYRCGLEGKTPYALKAKQQIKVGSKLLEVEKKRSRVRPGCDTGAEKSQPFGIGEMVRAGLRCAFVGSEKTVYLDYKYSCEPISVDGDIVTNMQFNGEETIELSWNVREDESGNLVTQSDFSDRHELVVVLGGNGLLPVNAIQLTYQANYSRDTRPKAVGTVQHTVTVNNTAAGSSSVQSASNAGTSSRTNSESGVREERTAVPASEASEVSESTDLRVGGVGVSAGTQPNENGASREIYALVEEWLARAEPIENASPGYDLHYDKWGRLSGKANNGLIEPHGNPDDAGGTEPAAYALARADRLDSLNLCTLASYIRKKSQGESLADCQKETSSPRTPDVVGLPVAEARSRLTSVGIATSLKAGSVSNTGAGTIERQLPTAGQILPGSGSVTLWVYRKGAATLVAVPDVRGLTEENAKSRLSTVGLKSALGFQSEEAPPGSNAGTVYHQSLAPGTQVAEASTITFNIYRKATPVTLGNLVGQSMQSANAALAQQGLHSKIVRDRETSVLSESGKVYKTLPAAGTIVTRGSEVILHVNSFKSKEPLTLAGAIQKGIPLRGDKVLFPEPAPVHRPPAPTTRQVPQSAPLPPTQRNPPASATRVPLRVPNMPRRFSCDARVPGLPVDQSAGDFMGTGPGLVSVSFQQSAYYSCWYLLNGKQILVSVKFYINPPQRDELRDEFNNNYCRPNPTRHFLLGGTAGKAMTLNMNSGKAQQLGAGRLSALADFHFRQVAGFTVSCR